VAASPLDELLATRTTDTTHWRPTLLSLERAEHVRQLESLAASDAIAFVHDSIDDQLRELVALREPSRKLTSDELDARVRAQLAGRSPAAYGAWAYFPWSRRLVHVLPREEHREVRTDRNRYKITRDEQQRLPAEGIVVRGEHRASVCLDLRGQTIELSAVRGFRFDGGQPDRAGGFLAADRLLA